MNEKDKALEIIRQYKDLIQSNRFNELYADLDKATSYYSEVSSITQLFIDAGVIDEVLSHLTIIPSGMFYGLPITNITIPGNITDIGWRAFGYCLELKSVIIEKGVTNIGTAAFYECSSLTSVTIPYGVTDIGNYAFCSCGNLKIVTIPNSMISIGNEAFSGNDSLTVVTIPSRFESKLEKIFGENYSRINFTFI